MDLYRWQKNCLRVWEIEGYHGIVQAVTGAGKTTFALAAIDHLRAEYPDLRVKIVTPTIALAQQWQMALLHHFGSEEWRPGFFGGGLKSRADKRMMLYVINSARDSLANHIKRDLPLSRHVLLICDECHRYVSPQNSRIFDIDPDTALNENLCFGLGLSATPATADNIMMRRLLGEVIYRYDFASAVQDGVVSPFCVCEVAASFLPSENDQYQVLSNEISIVIHKLLRKYPSLRGLKREHFMKEVSMIAKRADMDPSEPATLLLLKTYERKEISNLAQARVQCGIAILERLPLSDRVLVFCERLEQAEEIFNEIRLRWGNVCSIYHSKMTQGARNRNMSDFREKRTRILVSCRCLDEGLDVPDANIGIVLSSTAAARQRIQRLGRILRAAEGKAAACLYYIYIWESADDAAYLSGLGSYRSFSLRYDSYDSDFANELYEYAASQLLERARIQGFEEDQVKELRTCLLEGLARADYLLGCDALECKLRSASGTHERNYWLVMRTINRCFFVSAENEFEEKWRETE